jgi:hypothetical protein
MTDLEKLIEDLPPDLRQEVEDFARFLLTTRADSSNNPDGPRKLTLSWAGALAEYRDRFTSLELQKQSLRWWGA